MQTHVYFLKILSSSVAERSGTIARRALRDPRRPLNSPRGQHCPYIRDEQSGASAPVPRPDPPVACLRHWRRGWYLLDPCEACLELAVAAELEAFFAFF